MWISKIRKLFASRRVLTRLRASLDVSGSGSKDPRRLKAALRGHESRLSGGFEGFASGLLHLLHEFGAGFGGEHG